MQERMDAARTMQSLLVIVFLYLVGTFAQDDYSLSAPDPPEIRFLHIKSNIAYRFATTNVQSELANKDNKPREAIFTIQLPKSAFITTFSMTIEGVTYDGTVKEKEAARQEYIEAKRQGQSAGHIAATPRNTNSFEVSVNVAPQQKVTFNLTYQELLQRTLAMYQNILYINPGQIVNDLKVDVYINESREINALRVPALQKDVQDTLNTFEANPNANIQKISPTSAHVSYYPTAALQKEMSAMGITGQFVVQYDVQRGYDAGDIQVVDGYFVHFIAPAGLPSLKKNVLFILDISGSMVGHKIQQVKDAMKVILDDLEPGDLFNIFQFDDHVREWDDANLVPVNDTTLTMAKAHIQDMFTAGSTDINKALVEGIEFLTEQKIQENALNPSSLIVFLTDGDATSGVIDPTEIQANVRKANQDSGYSIFSLGFGEGVDFNFLRKISLQNNGVARKIYEDSDAALQLRGFYQEISTPLLSNVKIEYVDVENTTRDEFPIYFNGSEIIICGVFDPDYDTGADDDLVFRTKLHGTSNGNDVLIEKEVSVLNPSDTGLRISTERLWAYLTIKELLDKMEKETDEDAKAEYESKALSLSLKYSFVTPLTSMIVKKPNQNDSSSVLSDSDLARQTPDYWNQPGPVGLSAGNRRTYPPPPPPDYDDYDYDDLTTTTSTTRRPRKDQPPALTALYGEAAVGPRILFQSTRVNFCHDPPVQEGENIVFESDHMPFARVYAAFSVHPINGGLLMTGVRVDLPSKNFTMTANISDIDVICHGTPGKRTWEELEGTNQDLQMPGGQHHYHTGRKGHHGRPQNVWATMESHILRIHLSRSLCILVTRSYPSGLQTHVLNLQLESKVRRIPRFMRKMLANYIHGAPDTAGDYRMPDNTGSPNVLLPVSQAFTMQFENPFSLVEEGCDFFSN